MIEFMVHVLKFYAPLSSQEAGFLAQNCTYVALHDVWVFEGDYETFAEDELKKAQVVYPHAIVPTLGGLSDAAIGEIIGEFLP